MTKHTPNIFCIVLAAGKGSRMNSSLPKVLHQLGGKPILMHVLQTAENIANTTCVVIGHQAELVKDALRQESKSLHKEPYWAIQEEQLGTGHAVKTALRTLRDTKQSLHPQDLVVILYGDVPLIQSKTLNELIKLCEHHQLALISAKLEKPKGYGRIVRDIAGSVIKIVEHREANLKEKSIKEINSGIMAMTIENIEKWITQLKNNNVQKEFYLTDIVSICVTHGGRVGAYCIDSDTEIKGINSQTQRAELESLYQHTKILDMTESGLGVADMKRLDIRGKLIFGKDVFLDIGVIIEGDVRLDDGVSVGAYCILKNCHIGANSVIKPYTLIDNATSGENCTVGPYARLRPGTKLQNKVNIGNFVELKNSTVQPHSKINHLSYVGDSKVGTSTNLGAGTITCNYDGRNKHQTHIGNDVFIGSGTQLIAPVKIGDGATVGAGSTIYQEVKKNTLGLARTRQSEIKDWKSPRER